jgi:hypothetical protein
LGEPSNSNLNSNIEMMEVKASRPPRKSPNIPPARSRAGKSSTIASIVIRRSLCDLIRPLATPLEELRLVERGPSYVSRDCLRSTRIGRAIIEIHIRKADLANTRRP